MVLSLLERAKFTAHREWPRSVNRRFGHLGATWPKKRRQTKAVPAGRRGPLSSVVYENRGIRPSKPAGPGYLFPLLIGRVSECGRLSWAPFRSLAPVSQWPAGGTRGRSSAGFPVKKPTGLRWNPMLVTGMTGQSSGRTTWWAPKLYQTTRSVLSSGRSAWT